MNDQEWSKVLTATYPDTPDKDWDMMPVYDDGVTGDCHGWTFEESKSQYGSYDSYSLKEGENSGTLVEVSTIDNPIWKDYWRIATFFKDDILYHSSRRLDDGRWINAWEDVSVLLEVHPTDEVFSLYDIKYYDLQKLQKDQTPDKVVEIPKVMITVNGVEYNSTSIPPDREDTSSDDQQTNQEVFTIDLDTESQSREEEGQIKVGSNDLDIPEGNYLAKRIKLSMTPISNDSTDNQDIEDKTVNDEKLEAESEKPDSK